ncbi:hypothetical protein EC396_05440 [Lutibacter sp. HS1-25]|uniref:glycosyl hydrolase n=1 Tax=Lutibacter sp. HS1-25 TaxID=2485000 RepID=UPI0010137C6F|nr:glycosyl hydrolase [Lutibacter sp. HS1-25]RXP59345.1 hypothetical protein EC396_05440 [Lutibacter sp. HS1-25]
MRILLLGVLLLCVQCKSINENVEIKKNQSGSDFQKLSEGFKSPEMVYHPETWFHFNGNNISKEGITLDLEAIKYAGIQGIHLFSKNGRTFPGVKHTKLD